MREQAFAIAKTIRSTESRSDEVHRIWSRWTSNGVHACRYCGQPMILHEQRYCEQVRAEISEEENRL